jgi:hypothetical protein
MYSTKKTIKFIEEVINHPHRDELLKLMSEQIDDMNSVKYIDEDANKS